MSGVARELEVALPAAVDPRQATGREPWPALRVLAEDGVEELMFVHEPGLASDRRRRGSSSPHAAVLILPTIDAPAGRYTALASALCRAGMCVARAELRGQGHSRVELDDDSGYADLVERAIPAMVATLRRRWRRLPFYLLGHGAGGQLACLYAARSQVQLDGLILVGASGSDPLRERAAKIGRALLSDAQPRARLLDWARAGRRLCGSERDWDRALARVRLPALAVALERDDQSPRAAVEALLARLPRARCQRLHLRDAWSTHFGWLARPEPVVAQVCRWREQPRNRTGPRVQLAPKLLLGTTC